MHPDEQVVVALLGSSHISALRKRARAVVSGLVKKAVRETRMRGELWTSVMDALWGADELRTFRTSPSLDRHGIATVLGQWIQAQDDPAALRALVAQTRSEELVRYIAKEAPVVDLALMDAVFTASPNYAAQDLAGNHHLSAALREALLDRIATIAARGGESSMAGLSMRNAYTALLQQGLAFRPEHLERLNSASERHRKARTDSWKRECKRILAFFELHVQATGDEDLAFRIIEHARDMPGGRLWGLRLLQKAGGPESRLEVTRRLARAVVELWGDNRIVLENVARHAEARRDQDIRKRLLDSRSLKVYVELAKDPRPEDFRFLFERLVRSRPEASLQMAREAGDIARQVLSRVDLLPLLRSASRDVRLKAISIAGTLPESREPSARKSTRRRPAS